MVLSILKVKMEIFDINRIDSILRYEFEHLFSPEVRGMEGDKLIYEGQLKFGSLSALDPLVSRFHGLGYDVQILGNETRITLIFTHLQEARPTKSLKKEKRFGIHLFLFLLTFITTLWAGALQNNVDILTEPGKIWVGLPFAIPLLIILLAHEMGHYILSLRHNIRSTLPYFIPFPNIIGTMGAVIKMKSAIPDRKALMDVGMAGPLAGAILAIPTIIIGLKLSSIVTVTSTEMAGGINLGESLMFKMLTWMVHGHLPAKAQVMIHPMAFAGWVGLLVTFMNLFPASQLDGGHISYALFGRKHRTIGKITCLVFAIMGIFYWPWYIWMIFVFFIGLGHPPPMNEAEPLDRKRRILGFVCFALFILTCTPRPFYGLDIPVDLPSLIRAIIR